MGYSISSEQVRIDLWKSSGKWHDTIALRWDRYFITIAGKSEDLHETFARCMKEQHPDKYIGMRATCLEPYSEIALPISIEIK